MNQFKGYWDYIEGARHRVEQANEDLGLALEDARVFLGPRIEKLGELSKNANLAATELDEQGSLFHFKMTEEGVTFRDYWTCEVTFVLKNEYLGEDWEQKMVLDKEAGIISEMVDEEVQEAQERLELARLKLKYEH